MKYSIIIPTRDRHQTLESAIRSALSVPRDDLEVIVIDNFSSVETQELVNSIHDRRLVYTRSESRLSMTENFSRGILFSRGKYITIIGDDDCIIPSILPDIDNHLNNAEVVYWFRYPYFWPNAFENPGVLYGSLSSNFSLIASKNLLNNALTSYLNYQFLPSFYNSWVSRSVVDRITCFNQKHTLSSYVYPSNVISPDVYSSLLILLFTESVVYSSIPFSLSGISCFSNGIGLNHNNKDSQLFAQEYGYNSRRNMCHPMTHPLFDLCDQNRKTEILLMIASDYFYFLQAYKKLVRIDQNQLFLSILKELQVIMKWTPEYLKELQKEFNLSGQSSCSLIRRQRKNYLHYLFGIPKSKKFFINTKDWKVQNSYEAMILYDVILTGKVNVLKFRYSQILSGIQKLLKFLIPQKN